MRGWIGSLVAAAVWAALAPAAQAQVQKIYTCVDAKGRRITADRPIVDCLDREQAELSPTGQVVRKIGPAPTAAERAAAEEKAKREIEERNRIVEEKRRDRALLSRYPDQAAHDKERAQALAAIEAVIVTANRRTSELQWQRKKMDADLEFYGNDMNKAPHQLKRLFDENDSSIEAQKRFIADREEEKKRINKRYDEELLRLKVLWAHGAAQAASAPSRSSSSAAR